MVKRGVARDVIVNLWHTNQGGPGPHWMPIWSRGCPLPTWCRNKISALKEGMLPILVLFKTFKIHSGRNRTHWRISLSSDWGEWGRFCHRCFLYYPFGVVSSTWLLTIFLWYLYWKHQHRDHVVRPSFTIILRNSFSSWPFWREASHRLIRLQWRWNQGSTGILIDNSFSVSAQVHLVASCTNNNTQNMNTCGGAVVSANLIRLETLLWETVVWSWRRRARWQCRASWAPPA